MVPEGRIWIGVFDSSVLKGLFGPKTEEATGDWTEMHIEEL